MTLARYSEEDIHLGRVINARTAFSRTNTGEAFELPNYFSLQRFPALLDALDGFRVSISLPTVDVSCLD